MKRRKLGYKKEELLTFFEDAKNPEASQNALEFLLSEFRNAFGRIQISSPQQFQERRILFDKEDRSHIYFGLDPFSDDPKTQLLDVISSEKFEPKQFYEFIEKNIETGNITSEDHFIEIFELISNDYFIAGSDFSDDWAKVIIDAAYLALKLAPRTRIPFFSSSIDLARMALRAFLRTKEEDHQAELVIEQVRTQPDISFLCEFMRSAVGDSRNDYRGANPTKPMLGKGGDDARSLLLNRVHELAAENILISQADPSRIIWFWWGCGDDKNLFSFIEETLKSDDLAPRVLEAVIARVYSTGGDFDRVSKSNLEPLDPTDLFVETAKRLSESTNSDTAAFGKSFLEAVRRGETDPS